MWIFATHCHAQITLEHAEPRPGVLDRTIQPFVSESSLKIFVHILTLSICHSGAASTIGFRSEHGPAATRHSLLSTNRHL